MLESLAALYVRKMANGIRTKELSQMPCHGSSDPDFTIFSPTVERMKNITKNPKAITVGNP